MPPFKNVNTDQSNNQTVIPLPSSDPTADVQNSEAIFWADDAGNLLRVEAKTASGDVLSINLSAGVVLSVVNDWTAQQNFIETTLTDAALIEWNMNSNQNAAVTITANRTLNAPTNMKNGGQYGIRVIQNGTGGFLLAYDSVYLFPGGTVPQLNTLANQSTILWFQSDGTNMYFLTSTEDTGDPQDTITVIQDASTSRILSDTDSGKLIYMDNAAGITVTVNTGLKTGFNCQLIQKAAGVITIAGTATVNRDTATASQFDRLAILPDSTDTYTGILT